MPPQLALVLSVIFVYFAFRTEGKRCHDIPQGLFWPTLWYMIVSSHPIGYWAGLWGIPLPTGGGDATEGSIVDRYFFLCLTIIAFRILVRRGFSWGEALGANPWVTVFFAYMAVSIVWS